MSKQFAEQILDGMVDENGHCGERGLSAKQFTILSSYLTEKESEYVRSWNGSKGGRRDFWTTDYEGNIGKYHVVLNWYAHFRDRYTVTSIDLRDADEYKAEVEAMERLRELRDFSGSEWVSKPKNRLDIEITLVRVASFETRYGTMNVYTFNDGDGNCIVWKTGNDLCIYFEDVNDWGYAEVGDKVTMRATVKEHGEYKGVKQTVITRPQIKAIEEVA